MEYKKNINGKLALGYGSKYQLLRMLGWHRNEFNEIIAKTLKLENNNIKWFDFAYNGPCDSELLNLDFIDDLKDKWRTVWKCGGSGINWDAVGQSSDGTYIFLEAKAHLSELNSSAGGSDESVNHNKKIIQEFLYKYDIPKSEDEWSDNYYQLANRLIITDYVNANKKKAKLIYVLFENGYEFNREKNESASAEEWVRAINNELEQTGLKGTNAETIFNYCIINCNVRK